MEEFKEGSRADPRIVQVTKKNHDTRPKPMKTPKTNDETKNQWWHQKPTMTPKPTMTLGNPNNYETRLLSLACCTTCRLFRSQSQMTTDGLTRFGHYGAVGPFGEGPWRGQSKRLAGTLPNFWPFTRGPISRRTHFSCLCSCHEFGQFGQRIT